MAPRREEISPSMAQRDLLTSEPALIESPLLAAPTASSINSPMGSDSGKDCVLAAPVASEGSQDLHSLHSGGALVR
jgi:hypothetical protein